MKDIIIGMSLLLSVPLSIICSICIMYAEHTKQLDFQDLFNKEKSK